VQQIKPLIDKSKMTYVVLNKKNTLKVFQVDNNNNYANIPPGTLVDDVVVNSENFDFFLISQKTNQGLSQATHYNIIYDDFKVKTEDIQYLIYKLCYLYYNWTGGIKIPAPCQYAKKLAFLVGDKISSNKEIKLPDARFLKEIRSLYFL
jgi:aubergine-like protein